MLSGWEGLDELAKLPVHLGPIQALVQGVRGGHTVPLVGLFGVLPKQELETGEWPHPMSVGGGMPEPFSSAWRQLPAPAKERGLRPGKLQDAQWEQGTTPAWPQHDGEQAHPGTLGFGCALSWPLQSGEKKSSTRIPLGRHSQQEPPGAGEEEE